MSKFETPLVARAAEQRLDDWVDAGYIVRAHGVHGAMRAIFSHLGADPSDEHAGAFASAQDDVRFLSRLQSVRLVGKSGRTLLATLNAARLIHGAVLLSCVEIIGRQAAQLWTGATLQLRRSALPLPQSGEAYIYELIGAQVQDMQARRLGTVQHILDNAGQALMVLVQDDGQERLLPLAPETLFRIDRQAHALVVRVPEGLWEAS